MIAVYLQTLEPAVIEKDSLETLHEKYKLGKALKELKEWEKYVHFVANLLSPTKINLIIGESVQFYSK